MVSNEIISELSKRIDSLRTERNLSFKQMADLCDMDKAQIYQICTKGIDLRTTSLAKIAKGMNINITSLFDRVDN
jgi:transcriptional regulator with XRE-family HTH domain